MHAVASKDGVENFYFYQYRRELCVIGSGIHARRHLQEPSRFGCYILLGRCVVSKNEPAIFKLSCTGRLMNIS